MKRWLREPLVHFLALGALLFAVSQWRAGAGAAANRIVITPGQIDSMAATFARTWQRPPSEAEIKGLVDDYVRNELAAREAAAMGLDRDDSVIRRRLRQKLEFLIEDTLDAAPVTEADLQAFLEKAKDRFRTEPEVAFRQVYLSPDRRGEAVEGDARALLAKLAAAGNKVPSNAGDPLMLPREVERSTRTSVARQFGEDFADEVLKLEPGRWAGPVRSGYGLHLVFVDSRSEGRVPALDEVRPLVERELLAARRQQGIDAMYAKMLSRYKVVVEQRPRQPPQAGSGAGPAGR
jgi:hypothetical protein